MNFLSNVKEFVQSHKLAATTALCTLATAAPVFAEGETGYLSSTTFSGISANILADINTNIMPYAWPIFAVILAVGVGMRIFKKVC